MENNYEEQNPNPEENQNNDPNSGDASQENIENPTEEKGTSKTEILEDDWTTIEEDPTKIKIERDLSELSSGVIAFIKSTLSLRHGKYNYRKVLKETKENVVFQGYNVWILICSIVVASIGLDMNSVAVVIGAMLISPLMGPIRGIGFGVGMNDFPLLIQSFKNFGVMVGISLVTSVIYFLISPIDNIDNAQLLGRTEPNFLDAMIAFFGGLAGIIAASNGKTDTVISGVAIATALMPPLCTAGWGVANGEWTYFLGASYLFLLNSLFIALSTYVLLRYLRFPKREYVSDSVEKRVQLYTIIILVIIVAPSGYLFYRMAKKSNFESNTTLFVEKVVKNTERNIIVDANPIFDFDESVIELNVDNAYIDSTTLWSWNRQKEDYGLDYATIRVIQGEDINANMDKKIKEALGMTANQNELINMLREKELLIENMRTDFEKFRNNQEAGQLDLDYIIKGIKQENTEINNLAINRSFSINNNNQLDTNYIIAVNFNPNIDPLEQKKVKSRISRRFCFDLKEQANIELDSVSVVNF